ncbi:MAG: molybdate ABC transporter substrate-binding protein [Verrucomicrobiota bacterium]
MLFRRTIGAPCLAVLSGILTAGCSPVAESPSEGLTIFAAASLAEILPEVGTHFQKFHDIELEFHFASSGTLAQQLMASPSADIYLSASDRWLSEVEDMGVCDPETRRSLFSNSLVVVGNEQSNWNLVSPSKIPEIDFKWLVIGDPESVPAGEYAREWLSHLTTSEGSTVWSALRGRVSNAPDARAVLAQVKAHRSNLGITYATDFSMTPEGLNQLYQVPREIAPPIAYYAASISSTKQPELAISFLDFLESRLAKEIFTRHGFTEPN